MYYDSICLEGSLLQEMSYERSCIGEVHISRWHILQYCCVLLKDLSYWKLFFT